MKPGSISAGRLLLALFIAATLFTLISWDRRQPTHSFRHHQYQTDTVPKGKNEPREKKVRDLDEVLSELDAVDLKLELERAQKEIREALKEIDGQKIKMEIEQAMKQVDMDKIKAEMEEVKNINLEKLDKQMTEMREELEKIGPRIAEEMQKANIELEKAKTEIREYKSFVDGLANDGLIRKNENYSIIHKDGELTINGKKASRETYDKYRSFLEKHKTFSLKKDNDDFNIDVD